MRTLVHRCWELKMRQLLWDRVWQFLKVKLKELSYGPAIPPVGRYLPKRIENRDSNKSMYSRAHSSAIHNSHKRETTQVATNG